MQRYRQFFKGQDVTKNLIFLVVLAGSCFAINNCASEQDSSLNFSIPESSLFSLPIALEMHRQDILIKNQPLRICIENDPRLPEDEYLLDVEIAFAYWMHVSGTYDESDWETLRFELRQKCPDQINSYIALITTQRVSIRNNFNFREPNITCNSQDCELLVPDLGFTLSNSTLSVREFTLTVNQFPTMIAFNPYVTLSTLKDEIRINSKLSFSSRQELLNKYDDLQKSSNRSFVSLKSFILMLANQKLIRDEKPFKDFLNRHSQLQGFSNQISTGDLRVSWFNSLLHEVGHFWGLTHPDQDLDRTKTFFSSTTTEVNGRWQTKIATMAYGDAYLYLTEDDIAGAREVSNIAIEKVSGCFFEEVGLLEPRVCRGPHVPRDI